MKTVLQSMALCAGLSLAAAPAAAFVQLPNTGERVFGSANIDVDPLVVGADRAVLPGQIIPLPSNFVLLDGRFSIFKLPGEDFDDDPDDLFNAGIFFDAVFRDTTDDKLVFGSRISMFAIDDDDLEAEINDIFRRGFTGFEAFVAWTYVTANDLRLYSAARSSVSPIDDDDDDDDDNGLLSLMSDDDDEPVFDPDVIGLNTDLNVEEGNPESGWFLIKTNAQSYRVIANAIGVLQAGEEGQQPFTYNLDGFAPVPVPAALPLLASGLGLLVVRARRKRRETAA